MPEFLRKLFNREAPAPLTPTESLLKERQVKYKKQPDGTLFVRRDLDFAFRELESLPDLSTVVAGGNFNCGYNKKLTSLAGAPRTVEGEISCKRTRLSWVGPDKLTFGSLITDHGVYKNWDDIPEWLRLDDAGKRRLVETTSAADKAQLNAHLKWAVRTESAELAQLCIDKGADVNCDGGEPLMLAARRESMDMAKLLCLAGASIADAIKVARKKWFDAEDCDAGQLIVVDGPTHEYYRPIDIWLSEKAGALREEIQLKKIRDLEQANAGLQDRVTTLQADAEATKPVELDKPKMKPPGM